MMHERRQDAAYERVLREAREAEALRVLTVGLTARITEEARRTEEFLRRIRAGYVEYGEGHRG